MYNIRCINVSNKQTLLLAAHVADDISELHNTILFTTNDIAQVAILEQNHTILQGTCHMLMKNNYMYKYICLKWTWTSLLRLRDLFSVALHNLLGLITALARQIQIKVKVRFHPGFSSPAKACHVEALNI